jgi:hypothetical protein
MKDGNLTILFTKETRPFRAMCEGRTSRPCREPRACLGASLQYARRASGLMSRNPLRMPLHPFVTL